LGLIVLVEPQIITFIRTMISLTKSQYRINTLRITFMVITVHQ